MASVLHKEDIELDTEYGNILLSSARNRTEVRAVTPAVPGRNLLRVVAVSFGLLFVLQATLHACLHFTLSHQREEKQQTGNSAMIQQLEIKSHNLTRERDQLQARNYNLTRERDQLQARNYNLTRERDQLQARNYNLARERDQLQARNYNLTSKRDQLQARNYCLTRERDQLQARNYDHPQMRDLSCPQQWTKFQSSCYFISRSKKSWEESRQDCLQREADLVIINSREEQAFLKGFNTWLWIGLSDINQEGQWRWVDGSELTCGFWEAGEPNDDKGEEDCAESVHGAQAWNDVACSALRPSVCEKLPSI